MVNNNFNKYKKLIYNFDRLKPLQKFFTADNLPCPVTVIMDTTNKFCPHNCWYCYITQFSPHRPLFRESDELPINRTLKVIEEMGNAGVKAIEFCGAREPMAYPHINTLIKKIINCGIEFGIITNASMMNNEAAKLLANNATWVRISIDALDESIYEKIRKPRNVNYGLKTVLSNIEKMVKIKKINRSKTVFGASTIVVPENINQIYKLAKYSKSMSFAFHRFCTPTHPRTIAIFKKVLWKKVEREITKAVKDLEDNNFSIIKPTLSQKLNNIRVSHKTKRCFFSLLAIVIDANLNVYPCAETKWFKRFIIGNLKKESFGNIIKKKKRLKMISNISYCPVCCREEANIFLQDLFVFLPSDLNFLMRYTSSTSLKNKI